LSAATEPGGLWDGVDLAPLLSLERVGPDHYRSRCNDRNLGGEVFGGQYLGQALAAALASGENRAPHAMYGFFLKSARADRPLDLRVERVRDGRSFAHRRVLITQDGAPAFCADVSLHDAEPGQPEHQAAPPAVPPPEALPSLAEIAGRPGLVLNSLARSRATSKLSVDLRPVDERIGFDRRSAEAKAACWIRPRHLETQSLAGRYAALAYLSDYWANFACRLPHADCVLDGSLTATSLNHGLWFHRVPAPAEWLLFVMDSPATAGGTGLNRGLIYNRAGELVASLTQEGLTRWTGTGSAGLHAA